MERSSELSMDQTFLQKLTNAVFANLNNEQFGVEDLAKVVDLSRSQIHRRLNKINGKSITQFIREIRLEEAHRLLEEEIGTTSEIFYKVGFSSPTYFNTCFHEFFGYTPGDVKNKKKETPQYNKPSGEEDTTIIPIHGKESEFSEKYDQEVDDIDRRGLTTIMFTDIVGYTALMEDNEQKTFQLLEKNRKIQKPLIEIYHGQLLKEMGDGILASFTSVSDAAHCAQEILRVSKEERALKLHIGIHLGEVIFSGGDVFGDAVNIASRIQSSAGEGEIYISEEVWKNIKNKEDFPVEYVGEKSFKNIKEPIRIYKVIVEASTSSQTSSASPQDSTASHKDQKTSKRRMKLILSIVGVFLILMASFFIYNYLIKEESFIQSANTEINDKSIAILPFHNNSGNEALNHYGLGLATEVRSSLSYSKKFDFISAMQATIAYANTTASPMEIGQDLKVDYLLTGMYQIAGDRIKVDIEMVDTQTGNSIWTSSFNELFTDIFEVQSKIAGKVMNEFSSDQKIEYAVTTKNLEAYGQYLLGIMEKRNVLSQDYFMAAIQFDSAFIDAWVGLLLIESRRIHTKRFISTPELYYDSLLFEVNAHMAEFKKRFPDSWKNIMVQGYYAYLVKIDYEKAVELFNEVLIHDPENVEANHMLGSIYKRKLLHEKALKHNLKAFRQNPLQQSILQNIVQILGNMGDLENAIKVAQKGMEMFGSIGPLFTLNYSQGKISPPEFIEYVEQNLLNKYIQRDYSTIISMTNELEISTYANYYFKARSYFLLEELDSACHYAQMVTGQFRDGPYRYMLPIETMFIILGNKERAMELVQKKIDAAMQIGDHLIASSNYKFQIQLLSLLGDYEEATEKLLELNRKFPQFGNFAGLHNVPGFDKIKKEYPPFLEALNNLKLPKKSDFDMNELF